MRIEITGYVQGPVFLYKWKLNEGPEDIDEVEGVATSLDAAVAAIKDARQVIAMSYMEAAMESIESAEKE